MKVVFSRKGFDQGYGGMASPILPDGRLLPLPIPSDRDRTQIDNIGFNDVDLDAMLRDLSGGKYSARSTVHFDPDLGGNHTASIPGWRPAFGQSGPAQGHLSNNDVGPGDVFLFFGWYRRVEKLSGRWRFVPDAPDLHVIFGWLEIDEVLPVATDRAGSLKRHPWIATHPHVATPDRYTDPRNTLYVARKRSLFVAGIGAGRFRFMRPPMQLTLAGRTRSVWSLPSWFEPKERAPLTYHPGAACWEPDGDRVTLKTAAKGQEFVIDGKAYAELERWVANLVGEAA
ncbi:hypothetical protein [Cupriavidus consociatus]|uniref:Nmad3 family putative nucleotide modification protein n=1 Tax=Cupriavidus consociatus TaxID=2821357 RepID=UPI001AE599CA|nr:MULTISPECIES: hypothetical protein [unclassified Cupriavidus]MBP0620952.1 hypothetical protein [Cupriavidus sp. LEh25]MDK2657621.1 hypothetical protein [Cupriavidus sp. LEh21]